MGVGLGNQRGRFSPPAALAYPGRWEVTGEGRPEGYFLALLVQALIERELRRAMERRGIGELPLYPEDRECRRPTTEQVLRLFSLVGRDELGLGRHVIQVDDPKFTPLQERFLDLLGVPPRAYRGRA